MSVQQSVGRHGLTPFDAGPPGQSTDWADQLMQTFLRSTEIQPPADIAQRIRDRVAQEPQSTAPRQFVAALRARSLPGIWRGFVQSASAAFDPGTRSMVLRVQALIIVLVVIGATSFGGAAALAAAVRVVNEVRGPAVTEPRQSPDGTRSSQSVDPPAANGPRVKASKASSAAASAGARGRPAERVEPAGDGPSGQQPPSIAIAGNSDGAPRGPGQRAGAIGPERQRLRPRRVSRQLRQRAPGQGQGRQGAIGPEREREWPRRFHPQHQWPCRFFGQLRQGAPGQGQGRQDAIGPERQRLWPGRRLRGTRATGATARARTALRGTRATRQGQDGSPRQLRRTRRARTVLPATPATSRRDRPRARATQAPGAGRPRAGGSPGNSGAAPGQAEPPGNPGNEPQGQAQGQDGSQGNSDTAHGDKPAKDPAQPAWTGLTRLRAKARASDRRGRHRSGPCNHFASVTLNPLCRVRFDVTLVI